MALRQSRKKFVWTEPKELQLIRHYEKHPCLWDVSDIHYYNKEVGEKALAELAKQLGDGVSTNIIRTKFKRLQLESQRGHQRGLQRKCCPTQAQSSRYKSALSFLNKLSSTSKKRCSQGGKYNMHPIVLETENSKRYEVTTVVARGKNLLNKNSKLSKLTNKSVGKAGTSSVGNSTKNSTDNVANKKQVMIPIGPADGMKIPRFAGLSTFARLPRLDEVHHCDVAIVGIPFDAGTSYRPGARFGPAAIRAGSRLLRPYHPGLQVAPFEIIQVADCGDIAANPFKIDEALEQMTTAAMALISGGPIPIALGGDHTIALPMLRVVNALHGSIALLHFDAHLDTWDTYFGAPHTHGTVFRRASEEGLLDINRLTHVGIRGPLYSVNDLKADAELGFSIISTMDVAEIGVKTTAERIRRRIGNAPLYISIDIDVLDPAHAPGTGTPEAGGLSSRELLGILRELVGCNIVGADIVEVSPAYDHAEVTALAAAQVVYELISLIAIQHNSNRQS